jgi:hypothetical protein
MFERRNWRPVLAAAVVVVGLAPAPSYSFVETTETEGAVSPNVSGVWLVVSHIQFPKSSPTPEGAAAGPSPAASPAPGHKADAAQTGKNEATTRTFNVVNLLKITHLGKEGARALREEEERREQASVAKAKDIVADEQKKSNNIPVQTETGEVEGQPKVVVPTVPPKRQISPDDYFDVSLIDVEFSQDIQGSVDQAQKAEKAWVPSAKQLAQLKSSWSTLKTKTPPEYGKIEWKVTSADKFDDNLNTDEQTKGAKFVISGNEEMIPKPGVPKTNILVFGVRKIQPDVLEGGHVRAMMATAPFPLPIEMKGTFKMYKVSELPNEHAAAPAAAKSPAPKKK